LLSRSIPQQQKTQAKTEEEENQSFIRLFPKPPRQIRFCLFMMMMMINSPRVRPQQVSEPQLFRTKGFCGKGGCIEARNLIRKLKESPIFFFYNP